jgi:hypothetical protein
MLCGKYCYEVLLSAELISSKNPWKTCSMENPSVRNPGLKPTWMGVILKTLNVKTKLIFLKTCTGNIRDLRSMPSKQTADLQNLVRLSLLYAMMYTQQNSKVK